MTRSHSPTPTETPANKQDRSRTVAPADMVARILATTTRLTEVIDLETQTIKDRRPLDVLGLHAEKIRLANDYALDICEVNKHPHLVDRAPASDVARLKSAIGLLREHLDDNAEMLRAASSISQGLIKVVANAAVERQAPKIGYGENAAFAAPRTATPAALSLDEQV